MLKVFYTEDAGMCDRASHGGYVLHAGHP
jgi:hypothetical protein